MYVVSLFGVRPVPRSDHVPWNRARIEESDASDGVYAAIQTQTLSPLDSNPAAPQTRDLTTALATLVAGWYRVVFLDASDNVSLPTQPLHNTPEGTLPPTIADIRARSPMLRSRFPADPYSADRESALQTALDDAVALVASLTCRAIDETMPDDRRALAARAVTLKTEQLAVLSEAKRRRSLIGRGGLRSFSAGSYSESYFGPEEAAKAQRLDPDAAMHEVLWALATDECRQAWLALWTGEPTPAGAVAVFDWQGPGCRTPEFLR